MPTIDPLRATALPLDSGETAIAGNPANAVASDLANDPRYRTKVVAAAEKFESFFIADMLKQMRSVTRALADEDSVYRKRINQDMLEVADGKLADTLAGQRAFGIADAILRQLLPASATPTTPVTSAAMPESAPLSRR